jgi:hypothetical protein
MRAANIKDQEFGHLTALRRAGSSASGRALWECRCRCGTVKVIPAKLLRSGHTISCGCQGSRATIGSRTTTHGETKNEPTLEYTAWCVMIARCHSPNSAGFAKYGAAGISVCGKWRNSYPEFLGDMGRKPTPRHSLDRFPNQAGNYEPGNVRWATAQQQARNLRTNRNIECWGITQCLSAWAEQIGINPSTLHTRLSSCGTQTAMRGWSPWGEAFMVLP